MHTIKANSAKDKQPLDSHSLRIQCSEGNSFSTSAGLCEHDTSNAEHEYARMIISSCVVISRMDHSSAIGARQDKRDIFKRVMVTNKLLGCLLVDVDRSEPVQSQGVCRHQLNAQHLQPTIHIERSMS